MLRFDRRLLLNVDWLLVAAAAFIIMLSVLSLWSLAPGRGGGVLAWRQLSWVGVGLVACSPWSAWTTAAVRRLPPLPVGVPSPDGVHPRAHDLGARRYPAARHLQPSGSSARVRVVRRWR